MALWTRLSLALGRGLTLGTLLDRVESARGGEGIAHAAESALDYRTLVGPEISRRAARAFVARASAALVAAGVARGDRVIVLNENRLDTLYAILAVARAGAVACPLHPLARAHDLATIAEREHARTAIVSPAHFRDLDARKAAPGVERWILLGPEKNVPPGELSLDALAAAAAPDAPAVERAPEDLAVILYTSGTTGNPKGAQLSSRSLLSILRPLALANAWLIRGEAVLEALPIPHVMGLSVHLAALAAGVPVRHLARFDAERVLRLIEETRATVVVGVPTMFRALAEAKPDGFDLSSVRAWISGAAAMPPELIPRFKALGCSVKTFLGARLAEAFFIELYGSVELSGPALIRVCPPGLEPEGGFLGLPLLPYRTKIAGEDGEEVPRGETGELWIKGPGVMAGYAGNAEATSAATSGEWLRTGDLARRERFGLVRFVGRAKDVLKVSGYSVAPSDVEAALEGHPAVARAVAFGLRDDKKGEAPALAVVLKPGERASEEELLSYAKDRVAAYKRPRAIFLVSELPLGATMKVERRKLSERFSTP
ncbi:acyl--CoA ligase [bacterium]|nr:acyl--CoA ligase [bacterium]